MVDFRLYRLAFAPALLAVVALMFSLEGVAEPLEPAVSPASFEAGRASATAREIVETAPEREPGSDGDEAIADLVAERFSTIEAGTVSEQLVEESFDGEDVTLRNVIVTLPGESEETVVVLAARDSATPPGAASSAAATAALVELAAGLGVAGHDKTFVLASTSGAIDGASGARELLAGLADPAAVEAVVVISQPGATELRAPFAIATSTGANRSVDQLVETASAAVESQAGRSAPGTSVFDRIARLAIPAGLGEQAPLIDEGVPAVAISSAGERPLVPSRDREEDLSAATLGGFGRAAQLTVQAVDATTEPLEEGPAGYVEAGGNLVPGWSISLFALALLLPSLVAAIDTAARCRRWSEPLGRGVAWAGSRSLPLLGALAALYALALVTVVPRPPFPFDPGRFPVDARAVVAIVLTLAAAIASGWLLGVLRRPLGVPRSALVAGVGVVSAAAGMMAWISNPYLGLLVAPLANLWVVASRERGPAPVRIGVAAFAAAIGLLPLALAFGEVASALDLGADAPWTFVLMVADGQIGLFVALSVSFLVGTALATVVACRRDHEPPATTARVDGSPIAAQPPDDDKGGAQSAQNGGKGEMAWPT